MALSTGPKKTLITRSWVLTARPEQCAALGRWSSWDWRWCRSEPSTTRAKATWRRWPLRASESWWWPRDQMAAAEAAACWSRRRSSWWGSSDAATFAARRRLTLSFRWRPISSAWSTPCRRRQPSMSASLATSNAEGGPPNEVACRLARKNTKINLGIKSEHKNTIVIKSAPKYESNLNTKLKLESNLKTKIKSKSQNKIKIKISTQKYNWNQNLNYSNQNNNNNPNRHQIYDCWWQHSCGTKKVLSQTLI